MKKETVDLLMQAFGDLIRATAENHHKLTALESALETGSPELYGAYQAQLKRIRQPQMNVAGFASLQSKLLQD